MFGRPVIVGAGLSGLACAITLQQSGVSPLILDSSDQPGGRVRSDSVDGFVLDRGFQVYLTAYPEGERFFDLEDLDLGIFRPGALVRFRGKFHRLSDPWREPFSALRSLANPIGSLSDKLRLLGVRREALRGRTGSIYTRKNRSTASLLNDAGIGPSLRERFLRPFLGGIFLEADLETSSRVFEFVFRMFSRGLAALPSGGMRALPDQLHRRLDPGVLRTTARVVSVRNDGIILDSGEKITTDTVVLALPEPEAARLTADPAPAPGRRIHCYYFAADRAPVREPVLVLNGDGEGVINNLCFPSQVTSGYAPPGRTLVSVTAFPDPLRPKADLEPAIRRQLEEWFGSETRAWRYLRTYAIDFALPDQSVKRMETVEKPSRLRTGLYRAGDHLDLASINGALASGRRAAEAILADRKRGAV